MLRTSLTVESQAVIQAAVDDRYGDGTADGVNDYLRGDTTQDELATRWGMTQTGACRRLNKAKTLMRRLIHAAGVRPNSPSHNSHNGMAA